MSELKQAIAVGPYPAPCFDETWDSKERQHRRFLRRLAEQGKIRMVDSAGNALDVNAVFKGVIHYKDWHVDDQDAQVILEQIEVETARRQAEREEVEQAAKKQAEAEKKRKAEERKTRCVELKAAGLWSNPHYKTLKAALADGWQRLKDHEYGGEQMSLKGHMLARNPKVARSMTWWREAGFAIKPDERPHGQKFGEHGWYDVYRDDQVEQIPPKAKERRCLQCWERLPLDRFLDTERICVTCWSQRDEQKAEQKADERNKRQIEKDRKDYLKKTGFLPQ